MKENTKTAKCPECGSKYLVATGYCVSCEKKVAKPKKENTMIEVKEDVKIGDIILEAGDKIKVLKEDWATDILQNMTTIGHDSKNVVELIELIEDAFSMWVDGSQENFEDEDAQEWGYRNIKDSIDAGKNALTGYFTEVINNIWR